MRFENSVVIITGASRGIGKATSELFAAEGAIVVVNYLHSFTDANAVVQQIQHHGGKAMAIQCDVSQEADVVRMIQTVVSVFGRIDVLVNNAGIVSSTPLLERTTEQWRRTLDVNTLGTFLCSKYTAQQMLKQQSGKMVNISSTSAVHTFSPDIVDYDVSKAGIHAITKNFAKELAPNIQVNTIAPGWVNTPINADLSPKVKQEETKKIYLKRFAEPEEIAKVTAFLASRDASYITGSIIVVDGGHD